MSDVEDNFLNIFDTKIITPNPTDYCDLAAGGGRCSQINLSELIIWQKRSWIKWKILFLKLKQAHPPIFLTPNTSGLMFIWVVLAENMWNNWIKTEESLQGSRGRRKWGEENVFWRKNRSCFKLENTLKW